MVSGWLLEYELWTRLHACGLSESHGEAVRLLLEQIAMLELARRCVYLADHRQAVSLASYDRRMNAVADAMDLPLFDLSLP